MAGKLEAAIGFEPMNEGFADLCLSHLATPPCKIKKLKVKSYDHGSSILLTFNFLPKPSVHDMQNINRKEVCCQVN